MATGLEVAMPAQPPSRLSLRQAIEAMSNPIGANIASALSKNPQKAKLVVMRHGVRGEDAMAI